MRNHRCDIAFVELWRFLANSTKAGWISYPIDFLSDFGLRPRLS